MQEYVPFLFRAAQLSDLDAVYGFSQVAGLTNLPPDRELLEHNIRRSLHCFNNPPHAPDPNDFYFFVIENTLTQTPIGCCALYADIGTGFPFYTFHVDEEQNTLTLKTELQEASEMAALYLSPQERMHHMGAFLSRGRYLWIASHPKRFHPTLIAEMRGRVDKQSQSPFWELFVHRYIKDKTFQQADFDLVRHHLEFIDELLPHTPIAIDTLDQRARACIGIPHLATRAAVNLLQHEGFTKTKHINIFDGGPILSIPTKEIQTIARSFTARFAGARHPTSQDVYLVATTSFPFYVSLTTVDIDREKHCCYLPPEVAQRMQLNINDTLRLSIF
ncbi:MAG: arginine N-succinyltransferase [Gammaproteobacteria bacterium]